MFLLNKRGAILYEILIGISLLAITTTVIFSVFKTSSTNTSKNYLKHELYSINERSYMYFSKLNILPIKDGDYTLVNSNNYENFCNTFENNNRNLCIDAFDTNHDLSIFLYPYNSESSFNNLRSLGNKHINNHLNTLNFGVPQNQNIVRISILSTSNSFAVTSAYHGVITL